MPTDVLDKITASLMRSGAIVREMRPFQVSYKFATFFVDVALCVECDDRESSWTELIITSSRSRELLRRDSRKLKPGENLFAVDWEQLYQEVS